EREPRLRPAGRRASGGGPTRLEHPEEPEARDVLLLLPDPPIHAGRVPRHPVVPRRLAIVAAALALAACGGSSKTSSTVATHQATTPSNPAPAVNELSAAVHPTAS